MPDIFRGDYVDLPDATVTVNRFALDLKIVDSIDQKTTLADHQGIAKRLVWPDVLATLTLPQRRRVLQAALAEVVAIKVESVS